MNKSCLDWYLLLLLSCSVVSDSLTPWTAARQASLSFTVSQSLLKLMSIESVMPSNHFILCHPSSSCLQSFPASRPFLMSHLFTSGGSKYQSFRFSIGPSNSGLISKGLSRVFSSTTVQKHQFFGTQLSLQKSYFRIKITFTNNKGSDLKICLGARDRGTQFIPHQRLSLNLRSCTEF